MRSPGRNPRRSPASTAGRTRMMRRILSATQRLDRAGHGQIGLARARGTDAEGQVLGVDVGEIVALVSCRARGWCRARRAPNCRPRGSSTPSAPGMSRESRSARCTRSSDTSSLARGFEQVAHHVFGRVRARAGDAEIRAAPFHRHGHAVFDEAQVFVERAAEIREPRVVGGHEIEFADGFDGSGSGHQFSQCRGATRCSCAGMTLTRRPRKRLRPRLDDDHVDEMADEARRARRNSPSGRFPCGPRARAASFFDGRATSTRCVLPTICSLMARAWLVELRLQAREALLLHFERAHRPAARPRACPGAGCR